MRKSPPQTSLYHPSVTHTCRSLTVSEYCTCLRSTPSSPSSPTDISAATRTMISSRQVSLFGMRYTLFAPESHDPSSAAYEVSVSLSGHGAPDMWSVHKSSRRGERVQSFGRVVLRNMSARCVPQNNGEPAFLRNQKRTRAYGFTSPSLIPPRPNCALRTARMRRWIRRRWRERQHEGASATMLYTVFALGRVVSTLSLNRDCTWAGVSSARSTPALTAQIASDRCCRAGRGVPFGDSEGQQTPRLPQNQFYRSLGTDGQTAPGCRKLCRIIDIKCHQLSKSAMRWRASIPAFVGIPGFFARCLRTWALCTGGGMSFEETRLTRNRVWSMPPVS